MAIVERNCERRLQRIPAHLPRPACPAFTDHSPAALYPDDSDTNTASAVEGAVQKNLGTFQAKERDLLVESLPEEVIELGKKLPVDIRKQFVSLMTAWSAESKNMYNPKS